MKAGWPADLSIQSVRRGLCQRLPRSEPDELSPDPAAALPWLGGRNGFKSIVIDCFHKTISKNVQRHAEGADIFAARRSFLGFGTDCPIVEQRTVCNYGLASIDRNVWVYKVAIAVAMPRRNSAI